MGGTLPSTAVCCIRLEQNGCIIQLCIDMFPLQRLVVLQGWLPSLQEQSRILRLLPDCRTAGLEVPQLS